MTTLQGYADQYRWLHEYVLNELGAGTVGADPFARATAVANSYMWATIARALVDKAVLTDTDIQNSWDLVLESVFETVRHEPTNNIGIRYNLSPNPALANDATGWSVTAGTGTRTAVSGFERPNVYRVVGSPELKTPGAACAPGEVHTLSCWLQTSIGYEGDFAVSVVFYDASSVDVASTLATTFNIPTAATPTRLWQTVTVPPGTAVSMRMTVQFPATPGTYDATMALAEHVDTVLDYFDGDTSGAAWDGTAGSSTSTWEAS